MTPCIVERNLQCLEGEPRNFLPDGYLWGGDWEGAKLNIPSRTLVSTVAPEDHHLKPKSLNFSPSSNPPISVEGWRKIQPFPSQNTVSNVFILQITLFKMVTGERFCHQTTKDAHGLGKEADA